MKAAWVYFNAPGDLGWTYAHEQGRLEAVAAVPEVETVQDVFDGELRKQDGTVWVAHGSSLTIPQLLSMSEFVEGVVGNPQG